MQEDKLQSTRRAKPLAREHMPTEFGISLDRYFSRSGMGGGLPEGEPSLPEDYGPRQPMTGFEETYRNIIDYIVRITYKIWDARDVEYIDATYASDSNVYDDYGLQYGNQKIIGDTHHTTGAFSNIKLIADEIVWAGNNEIGYHTSHRTIIQGTNDGDSKYGSATGKDVRVMIIANCVAKDNKIYLEHVLYNNAALLMQMGMDLGEMTRNLVSNPPPGWPRDQDTWDHLRTATSPEVPLSLSSPIDGFDIDAFARKNLDAIWNQGNMDVLAHEYVSSFAFEGGSNRLFSGAADYADMVAEMRTAFPDLQLQVDEMYWMGNDEDGYLTSARWSATATHSGAGLFGEPTDREVQIWGITQHRIVEGKITHEWMLFNELDLMMQIEAAR